MDLFKATPINENYHYGMLGQFKVIIRTSDNWINISKLCSSAGIKIKEFWKWKQAEVHQEMLKYYSNIYEPLPDNNDENEPPPSGVVVQREYYCLDIIGDTELKGIPKQESNIIRGTYVPNLLAIQVAQWVSFDFGHKVSSIVVDHYKYSMVKKDETINEQRTAIEDLKRMEERLIQKINTQTNMIKEIEEKNQERHNELKGIISSAIKYLKLEENKSNREILLMYRLKEEAKEVLHIRAGKRTSFKIPKAEKCDYLFIGDHISNSKSAIRYLKKENILPSNGASSTYKINDDKTREKLFKIVNGINEEYKKIVDNK